MHGVAKSKIARKGRIVNSGINYGVAGSIVGGNNIINGVAVGGSGVSQHFDNEKLNKVDGDVEVSIDSCNVQKYARAGCTLRINDSHIGGIVRAGNTAQVDNSKCDETINAGNTLTCTRTICKGAVHAGNTLTMNGGEAKTASAGNTCNVFDCTITDSADAGNTLTVSNVKQLKKASSGNTLYITKCNDLKKANAGNDAVVRESKIAKELKCGTSVKLSKSNVKKIHIKKPPSGNIYQSNNNNFASNVVNSVMSSIFGGGIVNYGINSTNVYNSSVINGQRITSGSTIINQQIVTLKDHSEVGDIYFESGKGEVHVYDGCMITGKVTGGKVINK
jgi:hypothetical protein